MRKIIGLIVHRIGFARSASRQHARHGHLAREALDLIGGRYPAKLCGGEDQAFNNALAAALGMRCARAMCFRPTRNVLYLPLGHRPRATSFRERPTTRAADPHQEAITRRSDDSRWKRVG